MTSSPAASYSHKHGALPLTILLRSRCSQIRSNCTAVLSQSTRRFHYERGEQKFICPTRTISDCGAGFFIKTKRCDALHDPRPSVFSRRDETLKHYVRPKKAGLINEDCKRTVRRIPIYREPILAYWHWHVFVSYNLMSSVCLLGRGSMSK